jgi:acetyl-CoA C-acetyltransferase
MESIKDKIAIIGAGCTKFGEIWDKSFEDLVIDAAQEALKDAGMDIKDIDAFWAATQDTSCFASMITYPLKINYKQVGRVENACGTGTEGVRVAAYALASKTFDTAMVIGFEKMKDTGWSGIGAIGKVLAGGEPPVSTPGMYALSANRYFYQYKLSPRDGKEMLAKIAVKSHFNGALSPKAHFQRKITLEQAMNAPLMAWPLGLFDCCAVSDGAAAVIITRAELARNYRQDPVYIKSIQALEDACDGYLRDDYDYTHFEADYRWSQALYKEAGIKNPRKEISSIELHDCFTIAEAISLEDFGISPRGKVKEDIDAGTFNLGGELPVNADGGLKCFGHPVGATGLRQMYEQYKQLQGKAQLPERQIKNPKLMMIHARGGWPGHTMPVGAILGR